MDSYSRVLVDSAVRDLWFLGKPIQPDAKSMDARRFTSCERVGAVDLPLWLPIERPGRPARLTLGAFDMPVADRALAASLDEAAGSDIQLVPAIAQDGTELAIVNVLSCVGCLDETKTVGDKWTELHGRPDLIGRYRTITHLFIDPSRIDKEVFRVQGWKVALIVSDRLAKATGLATVEGVRLLPVS
jgi:hypothetical protein